MAERAVVISVKKKWIDKIFSGEKTIEIRKTVPMIAPPFTCYIYCVKDGGGESGGKIVGKFICEEIDRFTFKKGEFSPTKKPILENACVSAEELKDYIKTRRYGYALYIENPEKFEKPMALHEFNEIGKTKLNVAPQSWCYFDEV